MDGNRRWAKLQGTPSFEGHKAGYRVLTEMVRAARRQHIPHLVCYAFSTENWKRTEAEVGYLMELMHFALRELVSTFRKEGISINLRVVGERERLPEKLKEEIVRAEAANVEDAVITVWIAVSYGGRAEIVDAVNAVIDRGEKVTEKSFEKSLWTGDMPAPDIIVRTGGEKRLSNFLLWKASYSELFFTDTLWPDFGESEFQSILDEYGKRQRRNGI
jgi:undecaprenyl diphosphate synthase